jgi:hypothetical protein
MPSLTVNRLKVFLKLKCFSYIKILTSLLFEETLRAFFHFFLFFNTFLPLFLSLFFYDLSLEDLGVLMILEEKITSLKTSFQMKWYGLVKCGYRRWTHILEWSYARQYG